MSSPCRMSASAWRISASRGDGRLGVEDLERGQGPDLDLLLVLRQEVPGELERLLLDLRFSMA